MPARASAVASSSATRRAISPFSGLDSIGSRRTVRRSRPDVKNDGIDARTPVNTACSLRGWGGPSAPPRRARPPEPPPPPTHTPPPPPHPSLSLLLRPHLRP